MLSGSELKVEEEKAALAEHQEEAGNQFVDTALEDAIDDLGGRLPWESAAEAHATKKVPRSTRSASPEVLAEMKKSVRSSIVLTKKRAWGKKAKDSLGTPTKVDTSKLWGYQKHAERIRKARSDKRQRTNSLR